MNIMKVILLIKQFQKQFCHSENNLRSVSRFPKSKLCCFRFFQGCLFYLKPTKYHHANNLFCYYYDMLLHKKEVLALFRPSANFYCNLQDTKSEAEYYFYVMFPGLCNRLRLCKVLQIFVVHFFRKYTS